MFLLIIFREGSVNAFIRLGTQLPYEKNTPFVAVRNLAGETEDTAF
jgi:hypothetical protein